MAALPRRLADRLGRLEETLGGGGSALGRLTDPELMVILALCDDAAERAGAPRPFGNVRDPQRTSRPFDPMWLGAGDRSLIVDIAAMARARSAAEAKDLQVAARREVRRRLMEAAASASWAQECAVAFGMVRDSLSGSLAAESVARLAEGPAVAVSATHAIGDR